jgi:hypothetical protein
VSEQSQSAPGPDGCVGDEGATQEAIGSRGQDEQHREMPHAPASDGEEDEPAQPDEELLELTAGANEIASILEAEFGPGDPVDPDYVGLLNAQMQRVSARIASLEHENAEQQAVVVNLFEDVRLLHSKTEELTRLSEPIRRTTFDAIGHGVLFATFGAIGGALSGPAIGFALHQPITETVLEGAITGAISAASTEIARVIDPSELDAPPDGVARFDPDEKPEPEGQASPARHEEFVIRDRVIEEYDLE